MILAMRIVHFSDWHFNVTNLPSADLYVCTGDMWDDFYESPDESARLQVASMRHLKRHGGFRSFLGSPDAPIVCVRGNHDFAPLAPMFEGCNLVHEFICNELIEVLGLRVTGHRGIPWICGSWNDELRRPGLTQRVSDMPHADLILTHYPPFGVLDHDVMRGGHLEHYGLDGMAEAIESRPVDRTIHCFGHIHSQGGKMIERGEGALIGGTGKTCVFSNAACTFNVIEF